LRTRRPRRGAGLALAATAGNGVSEVCSALVTQMPLLPLPAEFAAR